MIGGRLLVVVRRGLRALVVRRVLLVGGCVRGLAVVVLRVGGAVVVLALRVPPAPLFARIRLSRGHRIRP